jgi:hypothetical protein
MEDFSENVIKVPEETITMEDLGENVIKEAEKMQPMKVKTEEEAKSSSSKWGEWLNRAIHYPRRYKLVDNKDARQKSMLTLQFAVMASAINTKMLNPNYAIMCSPGLDPDSFSDTASGLVSIRCVAPCLFLTCPAFTFAGSFRVQLGDILSSHDVLVGRCDCIPVSGNTLGPRRS